VALSGEKVLSLEKRSACDCYWGRLKLKEWQEQTCSSCEFGWVVVTPNPERGWERYCEPCKYCLEGKRIEGEIAKAKAEKKQTQLDNTCFGGGVYRTLVNKTFDNFEVTRGGNIEPKDVEELTYALSVVKAGAEGGRCLYLGGNPGIGKSHLAAAYLHFWVTRGKTGVFVSLIDLMQSLYETVANQDKELSWAKVLSRYSAAEVLVLDDLGQEKRTEKTMEVIFHILNHRLNRGLSTVVTSNLSLGRLRDEKGYSEGVISRLGSFERVVWDVKDFRLK
jgi:DNA replication protein DnaC